MNGIERADRLERKRPPAPFDDLRIDSQEEPMLRRGVQIRATLPRLGISNLSRGNGADETPTTLDDRQVRGEYDLRGRK